MIWTPIAASLGAASSVATLLTAFHLRLRLDVRASSVRWLLWLFFVMLFFRSAMRTVFFVWMATRPAKQLVDDGVFHSWTYGQLDRLGVRSVLYMQAANSPWMATILCGGDLALFGFAITLFPLTYELGRLARKSMDRGAAQERAQIQLYKSWIVTGVVGFGALQLVFVLVYGGYSSYTHRCLLGVYGVQILGVVFMVVQLLRLKVKGRNYETIHGLFVTSPVYLRLKRIMLVYALFALQFYLSMITLYVHDVAPDNSLTSAMGVSLVLHNVLGLALSITTSCSVACIFSVCRPCLPEDLEAQYFHRQFSEPMADEDMTPPSTSPVFVYTDIESSSALWNLADGDTMNKATEIHDNILRSSLPRHRGYEIATVGDAFQLAFHSIRDAVEYCLDVQLQLLVAKWPKELHGVVPATTKQWAGRRVIFNGLRVRMGIHDASDLDGKLIQCVHTVTGKTVYSGVSEVIADFVAELGAGGQILMTDRVASWVMRTNDQLSVNVFIEELGDWVVPQVNSSVGVFQVLPVILAARAAGFPVLPSSLPISRQGRFDSRTQRHLPGSRPPSSTALANTHGGILEGGDMKSPIEVPFELLQTPTAAEESLDLDTRPTLDSAAAG